MIGFINNARTRLFNLFLTHHSFAISRSQLLLCGILIFAGASRLARLSVPPQDYFDEIYHAFTARLILHNDSKPWEFWNENPTGHAYEWSHPPFAKLAMAASMKLFGENPFAWRLPSVIFGILTILMIYLLTLFLFRNEITALIAAALASTDGLLFTMSRIGKDDIYIPFFVLLSIYLFCKDHYFWSSVAFGFGLASKWNTLLLVPILIPTHFLLHKKIDRRYLWFFIMPPIVYVLNYLPMFLTGHDFQTFAEMQKVMFNFHRTVTPGHMCASPAWSWPLSIKPVYLYWNAICGDGIAMIYAMGNPLIFWCGLGCILMAIYYCVKEKSRSLLLLLFSYFTFFIPWILSPREMFLYLYLPSLAFMIIIMGYVLSKWPKLCNWFLTSSLALFIYFYPHWAALPIPHWLHESYFWFLSWRY